MFKAVALTVSALVRSGTLASPGRRLDGTLATETRGGCGKSTAKEVLPM
jgi:hypothetical protein